MKHKGMNMPDDKDQPVQVTVQEPEPQEPATGSVDVPLDNQPATPAAPKQEEGGFRVTESEWKSLQNSIHATKRVNEQLRRELDSMKPKAAPQPEVPITQNEYDKLVADGRWQDAVAALAEKKAAEIFRRQQEEETRKREQEVAQTRLETSKQKVISKYPMLDPETGDHECIESQLFIQVMNQHPEYLRNDYGPVLAMRDMEEIAAERGISLRRSINHNLATNQETVRRGRTNATSLPPSRPAMKNGNSYTISREQKELVDASGLDPTTYARIAKQLESGVEAVEA